MAFDSQQLELIRENAEKAVPTIHEKMRSLYKEELGREVLDFIVAKICGFYTAGIPADVNKLIAQESKREVAQMILTIISKKN